MEIHLLDQTMVFLYSCVLGAGLGLFYEVFRISRVAIRTPAAVIFLEDILFFCLCAVVTFLFMLRVNDGQVRFFILLGELLGGMVYYFTVGILMMKLSRAIIGFLKAVLGVIFRVVIRPVALLLYYVIMLCLKPLRWLGQIFKKMEQRAKYSLKRRRLLLYNYVKVQASRKGRKKHQEGSVPIDQAQDPIQR